MVNKYRKGYMAEWTLLHDLHKRGYAVMRAPHSGASSLPSPDVIAAKDGKVIVIECKSRASAFKIPAEQLQQLKEWQEKGNAKAYVGWKISRKGWLFFHLNDVLFNKGNVGKRFAQEKGINIADL